MSEEKQEKHKALLLEGRKKYILQLEKQVLQLDNLVTQLEKNFELELAKYLYGIVHTIKGSAPIFGYQQAGVIASEIVNEWEWTQDKAVQQDVMLPEKEISVRLQQAKEHLLQLKTELEIYQKELVLDHENTDHSSVPLFPSIGCRLLMVDDDDIFRSFFVQRLKAEGYEVDEARDIRTAKKLLTEQSYDLITLDLMMYPQTGYDLFHFLNDDPKLKWIPLIVLSGRGNVEDKVRCLHLGADDYVAKPFQYQELEARIYRLLTRSKQFEYMAFRDPLTGVFNRRYFDLQLQAELNRVKRYPAPLTLAIIDIDHFKQVNDTYGHHLGDLILQALCYMLESNIRATDILARFGGEEFILLFPQTTADQVSYILNKVMQDIRQQPIIEHEGIPHHVTFSAGITEWREGQSALEMVKLADEALYEAKNQGRDRISVEDKEGSTSFTVSEPLKKVLLVDDDKLTLSIVKSKLKELPIEMTEAQDGEMAYELLQKNRFDLCIIDGIMPRLDGFGLLEKMKSDPQLHHVKSMMLSSRKKEEDVVRGLMLGADDYMVKPFSLIELEIRVKRLLSID